MINRFTLAGALGFALAGCGSAPNFEKSETQLSLPAGVVKLASRQPETGDVTIPYTKYQLDNGLTVVLHKDTSDPLVHVDVTYHVGSSREELGKSGFAHFFEHMMFQGSKHVGDEQHFKIITEAGGDLNGTTNSDRTNYYQTVPSNQLEKVLWLEADRMGFLLEAVTQEKFEVQRATVKNERAQNYDNQPYGVRSERVGEALYPVGHPYSWSTIGYVEDLDRVNVNDLKAFFKRWYGPNNATLTIGGDIDEAQTLAWVTRYFGGIPKGPDVEPLVKTPVTLQQDRYLTMEDQVYLPLIQWTFPTVYVRHEDEAPLDVLSDILGGGKTSLFYKNLVKQQHAVQAVVSHPCRELACEFQLIALANPSQTPELATLHKVFEDTLVEFEQRGVNQDDLNRTKAGITSSTIFGLQSVSGKVSTLASNQVFDDEPDKVQYDLDRYNSVTAEDVMRVYQTYIKDKAKVVLSIVPAGQVALAVRDADYSPPARAFSDTSTTSDVAALNISDSFDRSVMPVAGPNPAVDIPSFWQSEFDNGLVILGHKTSETPTVTLTLSLEGGPLLDPIDKAGLASMTAAMMNESTGALSSEEMANELALLGASIQFSASGRYTQIRLSSLVDKLPATLALLKQKLFEPAFLESEFTLLKQRNLQAQQQQLKNPGALASRATKAIMYGQQNRISLPDGGTMTTLQNISLQDVKDFYAKYYSPVMGNMVIVGDISQESALSAVDFLSAWQAKEYAIPALGTFPTFAEPSIYLVDKPDAAQSVVRLVKRSMPYDATGEQFRSKLMNFALGGNFNSRINLVLREEKGYTYGASSSFAGGKSLGRFEAGADIKGDSTIDGIAVLMEEISNYRNTGITEPEIAMMRNAYTQSEALNYETPYSKAGFLRHLLTFNLSPDYREAQTKIINTISKQELDALARQHLPLDSMQLIIVGDSAQLREALEAFGRPVIDFQVPL